MTRTRSSDSVSRDDGVKGHHKDDRFKQEKLAERRGEATQETRERFQKALRKKEGQLAEQARQSNAEKKDPTLFDLSGKKSADAALTQRKKQGYEKTEVGQELEEESAGQDVKEFESGRSETHKQVTEHEMATQGAEQQIAALQTKAQTTDRQVKNEKEASRRTTTSYVAGKETSQSEVKDEVRQGTFSLQSRHAAMSLGEAVKSTVIHKTDLNSIVKQIADNLAILKSGDRIDTQITLRHPPAFEGATITVTEHGSAKGEFNLSFANLTNAAKALVDAMSNQNALREALENKGFVCHIITTNIEPEALLGAEHSQRSGEQDHKGQGDQQQGQDRQGDQEES